MMKKYDSYIDSGADWMGNVPKHWTISKVKYSCSTQKGKTPKSLLDIERENSLPYLSMDYLRGEPKQTFYVSNEEAVVVTEENQTLLLWDGSNAGEFIKSKRGVLSSTMALILNDSINKSFQWYFFKGFELLLKDSCNGMGIPHVDGKLFRSSTFVIPPSKEQTQIANYLDHKTFKLDDLISKKQKLIELLKEERTAIINQAVTKGLDPNVPMKDSGVEWLGEIPEHWKLSALKHYLSNITDGAHISPDRTEEKYPFVSTVDISNGKINFEDCIYTSDDCYDYLKRNRCQPVNGDILFSKDGTIGRTCIIDFNKDFVVASSLVIISPESPYLNQGYLNYVLNSSVCKDYTSMLLSGSALKRISISKIANMKITIPPMTEQIKIAYYLEDSLEKKDLLMKRIFQEIELLEEYKTALISEVVTGKVDVREEIIE